MSVRPEDIQAVHEGRLDDVPDWTGVMTPQFGEARVGLLEVADPLALQVYLLSYYRGRSVDLIGVSTKADGQEALISTQAYGGTFGLAQIDAQGRPYREARVYQLDTHLDPTGVDQVRMRNEYPGGQHTPMFPSIEVGFRYSDSAPDGTTMLLEKTVSAYVQGGLQQGTLTQLARVTPPNPGSTAPEIAYVDPWAALIAKTVTQIRPGYQSNASATHELVRRLAAGQASGRLDVQVGLVERDGGRAFTAFVVGEDGLRHYYVHIDAYGRTTHYAYLRNPISSAPDALALEEAGSGELQIATYANQHATPDIQTVRLENY